MSKEHVRLIDANAMRDDWMENGENEYVYDTNAVLDSIDSQPTVDAVEIVRCKDCFYYTPVEDNFGKCVFLIGEHQYVVPDGYCYLGERKEGSD